MEEIKRIFQEKSDHDMSLIIPLGMREACADANWLDKRKEVRDRFSQAAQEQTGLPTLSFPPSIPVFLRTVQPSTMTKTQYGDREICVVEILEPETIKENPPGTKMTMWISQEVFKTKLAPYRDVNGKLPADLELCIVNLGKVKGKKFSYNDYYIGTAEAGMSVIKGI